jgi:hypothetical protein
LPRLEANRYEANLKDAKRDGPWGSSKENNYFAVLRKVNQELIEVSYFRINDVFENVGSYV